MRPFYNNRLLERLRWLWAGPQRDPFGDMIPIESWATRYGGIFKWTLYEIRRWPEVSGTARLRWWAAILRGRAWQWQAENVRVTWALTWSGYVNDRQHGDYYEVTDRPRLDYNDPLWRSALQLQREAVEAILRAA